MDPVLDLRKFCCFASVLVPLFQAPAYAAPVVPDAGQTVRELESRPTVAPPKAGAPLRIEGESVSADAPGDGVRIAVKSIRVTGNTVVAGEELGALLADLVGDPTLAELNAGVKRITALYRSRGYALARAYLPAQEIRNGVVEIRVLEGRLDQRRLANRSAISDERVNEYLDVVRAGDVIRSDDLNRALFLLNDSPGVGGARATLQPGASVGTSDLAIELAPGVPYAGSVEFDNFGNRYTGEHRLGGSLAVNSPLGIGDQLTLRGLSSDLALVYGRLAYQFPVGVDGLRLGGAYSGTRYRLGKEFSALDGHGTADSGSLFAVYPLIRSEGTSFSASLTWEDKKLKDETGKPYLVIDKQVSLATLGLAGNLQDLLWGGGASALDLSLSSGRLGMDADSLAADQATARSSGRFVRLGYTLNRLQRLTDSESLYFGLSGQLANKNLGSSEKFSLGGSAGVRAYPQGEACGDEGWLANVELRHSYSHDLKVLAFLDAGSVVLSHSPFTAGANRRSISGAGLGANANLGGMQIKAYLAWRTGGGQPVSEPPSVSRGPRLWVQLASQF